MVHGCMVYTERAETAAVSCGTIHDSALVDIQKRGIKASHSCRITCELRESAGERRIAMYKSDHAAQFFVTLSRLIQVLDDDDELMLNVLRCHLTY